MDKIHDDNEKVNEKVAASAPQEKLSINVEASEPVNTTDAKASIFGELSSLQNSDIEERRNGGELTVSAYDPGEYKYFKRQQIADSVEMPAKLVKDATRMIQNDASLDFKVSFGYFQGNMSDNAGGEAFVSSRMEYWNSRIQFNRNSVIAASCSDWTCRRTHNNSDLGYALCIHEVVCLMLLLNYLKTHDTGDYTNYSGELFMNGFDYSKADITDNNGEQLRARSLFLVPSVTIDDDRRILLSFRCGNDKLYKIKKLNEFRKAVHNKEVMTLSAKSSALMDSRLFDESSAEWFSFLKEYLSNEGMRSDNVVMSSRKYYNAPQSFISTVKDSLPLYGNWLDKFYDIFEKQNKKIEFTYHDSDSYRKIKAFLTSNNDVQGIDMVLAPVMSEENIFEGVALTGAVPSYFYGSTSAYYIAEPFFYRTGPENVDVLKNLTMNASEGIVDIHIGRNSLSDFYRKVLPSLHGVVDITEKDGETIRKFLPPEAEFVFYLDSMESLMICKCTAIYGGNITTISDVLSEEFDGDYISGEKKAFYRDNVKEKMVCSMLHRYFREYDASEGAVVTDNEDDIYEMVDHGIDELIAIGEVRSTDRFRRMGIRNSVKLNVGVNLENNLMKIGVTSDEVSESELLEMLRGYRFKKHYYRLKSGEFVKLYSDEDMNGSVAALASMMETLQVSAAQFVKGKMQIPAYRALYLEKMLEDTENLYAQRDTHFKKLIKDFKTVDDADFELPSDMKKILRKYQLTGYRWLRTLDACGFGGILADDMGLGKTIQVIAVLLAVSIEEKELQTPATSIIIVPASLVYNWKEEIARFAPSLKVSLITGTKKERNEKIAAYEESDVLVTSYDLLKRDIDEYEGKHFRFEIIDEAQFIKNSGTASAQSVKVIESVTRFALTGTPIENRLSELWSIFDYLMPGFLYGYDNFRTKLETPIVKSGDTEAADRLRKMVSPFILRRLKKDVLKDLPEKLEEIYYSGMDKEQRDLYNAQVVRMKNDLEEQQNESMFNKNRFQILSDLTRIRQICCDPALCFDDYKGESAKRSSCMELIDRVISGEHKALVFSQFTSMLELLEKDLTAAGISFYKITGATPKEKRIEMVKAFNGDDTPVFLISLKAGGTGLNLTGADVVIHYDPWWNLAVQNQATDRAYRIGQERKVTVYKLIIKNTIEEKIVEMQDAKRKLAEDILGADEIGSSAISREDLLSLLE